MVNLLIVDDEPKNLTVLESILQDPGYRLVRADSGEKALLALMEDEFAVLILDVQMPGMTGFELVEMIKQRKRTATVPIIFLTAYMHGDGDVLDGYHSGAADYLQKPVNPTVLRSKVAVFADLHRKTRRLAAEVAERNLAQARLAELNATLDRRVAERTSALEQSEARLREVDTRKDEFLATLAHELRSPLAPIRNAAQIVKAKAAASTELQWASGVIDRQVMAMSRLIEDLMDVSRINRGRFELRREVVDVQSCVQEAIESVQPIVAECGHELQVHPAGEPLPVDADCARMAQALVNLLTNAAKYTERGGRIVLTTRRDEGFAVLTVSDNGIGIAPDRLENVFEMFSQDESALARSRGGIGIGLALTRRLVEMHGGTVLARSAGLGQGSEFEIRLPIVQGRPGIPAAGGAENARRQAPPLRILLAEDERDTAETLTKVLEMRGHTVVNVQDGMRAVEIAASFKPQLVLLDIRMPKLNGYEACQRIRALPSQQKCTIAALTGLGQASDRLRSQRAGFDRHLVKPIELAEVDELLWHAAHG